MTCPACGRENREAVRFCEECGTALALRCATCGSQLPSTAKFCGECGASLATSDKPVLSNVEGLKAQSPTAAAHLTTNNLTTSNLPPRAYTPKHLAEGEVDSRESRVESREFSLSPLLSLDCRLSTSPSARCLGV